ncbi:MAG TPA: DUF4260 domain-containing protein [Terracidiphilus sp.]|jgi:hypothetical protein
MATQVNGITQSNATANGSVLTLLRLEGLAVALVSAVLYAHTGASWGLFAAFWLVPDLSMLGYLAGSCQGARVYNAMHTYVLPGALALSSLLLHVPVLLPFALIWTNHIGVDRLMGYGLKYSNGFGWTHLGRLGKQHPTLPVQP